VARRHAAFVALTCGTALPTYLNRRFISAGRHAPLAYSTADLTFSLATPLCRISYRHHSTTTLSPYRIFSCAFMGVSFMPDDTSRDT